MSSTTPPNSGTLAPHTPLRPAAVVTGHRGLVADAHDGGHLGGVDGTAHDRRR